MSEEELRREAVRRRQAGEGTEEVAASLGRSARWVRKWTARALEETENLEWAKDRSRAPHHSPRRLAPELRRAIVEARSRLTANPRAQYGPLAIAWELRRMGVEPIPPRWTIERVIAAEGLSRPRRRQGERYASKSVPYPVEPDPVPGRTHQVDLIGPRHLQGAVEFYALNLIDVGSHAAASSVLSVLRPGNLAKSLVELWGRVGIPKVAQFDNHANFRGAIQPDFSHFGPVVATCLDFEVVPRFIPIREPWRNGVIEHFNDVWDKSFFRTERFGDLTHLVKENASFVAFHNRHHRYSAHGGASPEEIWAGREFSTPIRGYRVPERLPPKGRIEVIRYIRSNRVIDLFGKRLRVDETHIHQYVTAIIRVRTKQVTVVTIDGEVIHDGDFSLSKQLR